MVSVIHSAALLGIDALEVQIEVDSTDGLPGFSLVGLPDSAVRESRERIGAALKNEGFNFVKQRTTISMAPADLRKEGAAYDLPLALGLLLASEQVIGPEMSGWMVIGELSLRGHLRPVRGALAIAMMARARGYHSLLLPRENAAEVEVLQGIEIHVASRLNEVLEIIHGSREYRIEPIAELPDGSAGQHLLDFADVKGQRGARRAMEVAAAGAHNFLLMGCPGGGKSMCARRLPSILPRMNLEECLDVTRIHSAAGLLKHQGQLISQRPFRSPHHTISNASLVGGGSMPRPGEVSLAHHGLLFLDELLEFQKPVLETLRQPIEDGVVTISRTAQTLTFPSRFMLGAAMNPCPCGYVGHRQIPCRCSGSDIQRYLNRLSGPLLDRIDIHIEVPSLSYEEMESQQTGEPSFKIRQRVQRAREIQNIRFSQQEGVHCNSHMGADLVRVHCELDEGSRMLLREATEHFGLSARAHDRVLKLARTIADLAEQEKIREDDLAESLQYRCLDRYRSEKIKELQKNVVL